MESTSEAGDILLSPETAEDSTTAHLERRPGRRILLRASHDAERASSRSPTSGARLETVVPAPLRAQLLEVGRSRASTERCDRFVRFRGSTISSRRGAGRRAAALDRSSGASRPPRTSTKSRSSRATSTGTAAASSSSRALRTPRATTRSGSSGRSALSSTGTHRCRCTSESAAAACSAARWVPRSAGPTRSWATRPRWPHG